MAQRLTFVIHALTSGGAERVIAKLASGFAERGRDVTLITLSDAESDSYELSEQVVRVGLGLMKGSRNPFEAVWNNIQRLRELRRAIRASRPDKVVSFIDKMNILTLLACFGSGLEIIISERVTPRLHRIGRMWNALRRLAYPHCRALVVQTETIARQMSNQVGHRPIYVIPNSIVAPSGSAADSRNSRKDGFLIVGMGRLERQKGFDLLIEAFSRIAGKFPEWSIQILGEGSQRALLEQLVRERRLEGRVQFSGWTRNPFTILSVANLFVLSSRYEGFPNSLLEAMACGLPVVSFDCEDGPGRIIRHDVDGLLVPEEDTAALANALTCMMSDPDLRERFGRRAREVTETFSDDRFFSAWESVFED